MGRVTAAKAKERHAVGRKVNMLKYSSGFFGACNVHGLITSQHNILQQKKLPS